MRFAVAMACSPATPLPITNALAGRTEPAAVVSMGMALGNMDAPCTTAWYPWRLGWNSHPCLGRW